MSLSILIPIYNFDVKNLVEDLHLQCKELDIDFEIVLVDDFSKSDFHKENETLESFSNVTYEQLKENVGRSKIRNYLLQKATYENCLILDCDVAIVSSSFIKNYLDAVKENTVVVGGHIYQKNQPKDKSLMLHWKYGTQVECKSLKERLKKPNDSFMTNSFLIQKKVCNKVKFDESLVKYGHEDTLFGIELELNRIQIKHIENPVLHLGLKSTKEFLRGEKEAISNLIFLSNNDEYQKKMIEKSRLLRNEKSVFLNFYYGILSYLHRDWLSKRVFNKNPDLESLNFWKFITLKELRKEHQID